ncbi:MAG: cyclopropane-fatty-acyl-phospholipid synthase family protein [Gammaproteobacteria bacterium]|nr:cyclopropane-fatty-acyl-phospholipid synthase family protein [Gammaproteobacteria bacterium]
MSAVAAKAISWTEAGLVPDSVIRSGIRRLLERKRQEIHADDVEASARRLSEFADMMRGSPVALVPELANEQHYEVPAEFFVEVLGEQRKYSCCHWGPDTKSLDAAEREALLITVARAGIKDGMQILDLGCGWGSLSLWIAERYPNARITSVSNSQSQHDFIQEQAGVRGLTNINVQVCDMNDFETDKLFDRIVSVEMFEHMRNYAELFQRIESWLVLDGRFFMHIFTHRTTPYEFVDKGPSDWMSRHFFSGGIMPSTDLPLLFADHLVLDKRWRWNGQHYGRTARAWLNLMDARKSRVMPILASTYGDADAGRWWTRWRMFFMACEELFNYNEGTEWYVTHYLFRKRIQ